MSNDLEIIYEEVELVDPKKNSFAERHKTELCESYQENEECKFGDKRIDAHGTHELRGYGDPATKEDIEMYEEFEK